MKDPQQQTFVTKHDLELLHKKIIATDLIVQKYQEANKALLRLQAENDALKQQVEQITNECCIFGKQVTECTQECDSLKDQLAVSNAEKREMQEHIRELQDENTSRYHEIMVLKQYESLKETNDQLSKTVERQQKHLSKLQLQVQRQSPIIYKPNKEREEPSEKDIALVNSQKAIRELRLTLGSLMNYIQTSKIEIPAALNIRPVLKAHNINDDFLEVEGVLLRKAGRKKRKPVVVETVVENHADDDDDDDDNGDFVEVTSSVPVPPVNNNIPPAEPAANVPTTSKAPSRQQQKKQEKAKAKSAKKRRRSEDEAARIKDMATELEMALSESTRQEPILQPPSIFSDDDRDEGVTQPVNQQHVTSSQKSTVPPSSTIPLKTNSSIIIIRKAPEPVSRTLSFFSDDDNEDISPHKPPPVSSFTQRSTMVTRSAAAAATAPSLPVKSTLSKEHQPESQTSSYMPSLSEDETDHKSQSSVASTPMITQAPTLEEFNSSMELSATTPDPVTDVFHPRSPLSAIPVLTPSVSQQSPLSFSEEPTPNKPEDDNRTAPTAPPKTLDARHTDIVLRLLNLVTHVPAAWTPLRLVRRRIPRKTVSKQQNLIPSEEKTDVPTAEPIAQPPVEPMLESSAPVVAVPEEPSEVVDELNTTVDEKLDGEEPLPAESPAVPMDVSEPVEQPSMSTDETDAGTDVVPENTAATPMEKPPAPSAPTIELAEKERPQPIEEHPPSVKATEQTSSIVTPTIPIDDGQTSNANQINHRAFHSQPAPSTMPKKFVDKPKSQEPKPMSNSKPVRQSLPPPIAKTPRPLVLKPFQIATITRLLNVLVNLPVQPLALPSLRPSRKRARKAIVTKPLAVRPQPTTTTTTTTTIRAPRSPTRMQTRSLSSIRACIARCNKPAAATRKRAAAEETSVSPPKIPKRMKPTTPNESANNADPIENFLLSFSKDIHADLTQLIDRKLNENMASFNEHVYRLVSGLLFSKCDVILPLVKQLHPYEESVKVLLTCINSKSAAFQQHFHGRLNRAFESEVKQQVQISHTQVKILNRLFFLSCTAFALSSSATLYARLFDIGCYLPRDHLTDALSFAAHQCTSLISIDSRTQSSNVLLHQTIFDILPDNPSKISVDNIGNLFIAYHRHTHDRDDLVRSFVLLSRQQPWAWWTNDVCGKLLFPLLKQLIGQQRETILTILQYVLFLHRENEHFQRDRIFADQAQQLLRSLQTLTREECLVRDRIVCTLHTSCHINE